MAGAPDPKVVDRLQRTFSGLDDNLNYQDGHGISRGYNTYKNAHKDANAAATTYRDAAEGLQLNRPYDQNNQPIGGLVAGRMFNGTGHRALDPVAGNAADAFNVHTERRESFNNKYKEVLIAKNEYAGHVQQAVQSQKAETRYNRIQQQHQQYGQQQQTRQQPQAQQQPQAINPGDWVWYDQYQKWGRQVQGTWEWA
ncbi:hypothetical protein BU26DRAFT_559543 [Trematosphaeria pertusa]|uniref:Uncharacterized protein n=1 Tax=Trematosphaeria pertusa TaxID=390896 RepID=A0A6A6IXZ1_9PLEO|nr:uncharacterized protein BU26DRAFT_559543 [Trematosphaeria pertusa]KAF2254897.1 hypothetical protein BU26DRAFT_559543 [Trematosphaeria pertusa]